MENGLITADIHPSGPAPSTAGWGDHLESITSTNRSFIKQRVTFHSVALRWDRQRQPDYSRSYSVAQPQQQQNQRGFCGGIRRTTS